jgi:hypothetical protein
MAKFKTTHILTVGDHQIGEGSEDAKEGRIELRLYPAIRLSWEDELDIRLTPVVGNPNKATRRKK